MDARLVDAGTHKVVPARDVVHRLCDRLRERARELDCVQYLERVHAMADGPTGSVMQLELFRETGKLEEVVRRMVGLSYKSRGSVRTDRGRG